MHGWLQTAQNRLVIQSFIPGLFFHSQCNIIVLGKQKQMPQKKPRNNRKTKQKIEVTEGVKMMRGVTLATGFIGVIPTIVGSVADPGRVDAQGGGVAAEERRLLRAQLVVICAAHVICEHSGAQDITDHTGERGGDNTTR